MKLPKFVLGIDHSTGNTDFTVLAVIKLTPEKDLLSVNIEIVETVVKDFRYFDEEFTDKILKREKAILMEKYNIKPEDVL